MCIPSIHRNGCSQSIVFLYLVLTSLIVLGARPQNSEALPKVRVSQHQSTQAFGPNIHFRPKSGNPKPEKTVSGGPRSGSTPQSPNSPGIEPNPKIVPLCEQDASVQPLSDAEPLLRAVAPAGVMKLTASARPIFWMTLPSTQATQVILSIEKITDSETQTRKFHSQQAYSISQTPVLMGLQMPDDVPDLEFNTLYRWSVQLICGENPHPSNPSIFATIKRVETSLPLPSETPSKKQVIQHVIHQAIALSQEGVWYDPVSMLLTAYQANPTDPDIPQLWQQFMKSGDLEAIAQSYGPNKSPIQFP